MTAPPPDFTTFADALTGQYAIEKEIGRGGMGVVYLARDLKLDRLVAIKTLPPHLAADPQIRERFLREARTAAALSHPNIVPIYRADELGGQVFFVMAYVNGESLAERIRRLGCIDPREVVHELRDVALALDYANAHGVVHRDVKAENILLDQTTGRAIVTDFGIARMAEATPMTSTGQVLGTVHYMSPEQASGETVDGRSDLYALGVVGYLALSGRFPFDNELASAVLIAHVNKAPPPMLTVAPNVPRALAEIVDYCLAKDPGTRFQTGREMAAALTAAEPEVERDAATSASLGTTQLSDDEAGAIWKRAAELQAMTGVQVRPMPVPRARDASKDANVTSGYKLDEVRSAALEAGIPAQYVEHALAEHGLVPVKGQPTALTEITVKDFSPKPSPFSGSPMAIEFEVVLDGEVSDRDHDLLVDTIRRRMELPGTISGIGRSLSWHVMARRRSVEISVLPRAGKTTIRVTESMSGLARQTFAPIMAGGGIALGNGMFAVVMTHLARHDPSAALWAAPVWAGSVFASWIAARLVFRRSVKRRTIRFRGLIEELAAQVRDSIAKDAAPRLPTATPPRLRP